MNKVVIICPIYNTFPEIVSSLINQTHKDWELLLIHDGPNATRLGQLIEFIGDVRIRYWETEERKGLWGHPLRQSSLKDMNVLCPDADFVLITNGDNHYVPHFLEYMLKGFSKNTLITYCSQFIHAYESWQKTTIVENMQQNVKNIDWEVYKYGIIDTRLELGYIDIGCVLVDRKIAIETGWPSFEHSSDWDFINLIIQKYGTNKFKLIRGCLFSHN
jgi:hypothetical protein